MKQVKIILGRFQPFHLGHLTIATLSKLNGPDAEQKNKLREQPDLKEVEKQKTIILAVSTPKEKVDARHPFEDDIMKKEFEIIKKNYKEIEDVLYVKSADICAWGEILKQKGYQASIWITGSDEFAFYKGMALKVPEYEEHNRDNRDFKDACAKSFYVEEVKRNDNSDNFIETISGTKVREALKNDDKETFSKMMPKGVDSLFDEFKEAVLNAPEPKPKKTNKIKECRLTTYMEANNIKSLSEYAKEKLFFEGGHSVEGVSPIRGDLAKVVADEIIAALVKEFKCECAALGSTGKKPKDQTSGDIDIALEYPWENKDKVLEFIKKTWSEAKQGNIVPSLHVFNIGYKYNDDNEEKFVQVDFMFVENIEFAKFCYHSPSFINNESKFKGAWRTQLMTGVINCLDPVELFGKQYKEEDFTKDDYDGSYAGEPKFIWRILFTKNDGLKLVKRSYEGKTKPIKTPKNIETKIISKNPDEIIKICFGEDATKETMNSYETILDYISSDKFKFRSRSFLEKVEEWLFSNEDLLHGMNEQTIKDAKELFENTIISI